MKTPNFLERLFGIEEPVEKGFKAPIQIIEEKIPKPEKSDNVRLVEAIHREIDGEMALILNEMGISLPLEELNIPLKEKAEKLKALGFHNSEEVKTIEAQIKENEGRHRENLKRAQIVSDIKALSHKYPHYRIITTDSLDKVCEKYGLHYSSVRFFNGSIPDKNLKELINHKIAEEDKAAIGLYWYDHHDADYYEVERLDKVKTEAEISPQYLYKWSYDNNPYKPENFLGRKPSAFRAPLIIAATFGDFKFPRHVRVEKTKSGAIIKEDPIVMQPIQIDARTYYAVITAWGPEGTDTDIVNPKNN